MQAEDSQRPPMLAGLLLGIVHDRRLLWEAQINLGNRWFRGYGLHERLPDHSSLDPDSAALGRGALPADLSAHGRGVAAGIAEGEVVHVDSSLVRTDVSREAIARRHAEAVSAER